jgi:hypothetical protein
VPRARCSGVLGAWVEGLQQPPAVVFESYDDQDYGYLRILVNENQLRIGYHPSTDGDSAKTPDDAVTVDLATHQIVHYQAPPPAANDGRSGGTAHRG